jgi:hypothetical protein
VRKLTRKEKEVISVPDHLSALQSMARVAQSGIALEVVSGD